MSSTGVTGGRDIWDRFEEALLHGETASQFWLGLDRASRTPETLVDFLLIQFESCAAPSKVTDLVKQLEHWIGCDPLVGKLVGGAYRNLVRLPSKPHVDSFDLPPLHQKWLALPTDPFYLGQIIDGRYRVEQRIGDGTFGVVYKLHDRSTGESVACKSAHVTPNEWKCRVRSRQLRKEKLAMQKLSGNGCPRCFGLSKHNEPPFITMEFIDGVSLRDYLAGSHLDPRRAARYMAAVSRTLGFAHQEEIVHRDLKPENVIIDTRDNVFVVDFGLVGCMKLKKKHILDPIIAGTRGYMAPEILSADRDGQFDGRADIYSVGVMIYELVTGERPRIASEQCRARVEWPESIPHQLARIGVQCLERDPRDRYQDANQLAAELQSFADKS